MTIFEGRAPLPETTRSSETFSAEDDGRLLSARIADEIRSAVLSGEMRPGMRIRQELLAGFQIRRFVDLHIFPRQQVANVAGAHVVFRDQQQ